MLPKENRLLKNRDFKRVYKATSNSKSAPKIRGAFLSIRLIARNRAIKSEPGVLAQGSRGPSRFGIIIPNRVIAKANQRNLVKRRLREALRGYLGRIKPGHDVIIKLERPPLKEKIDFSLEVEKLLNRARLLR